MGLPLDLQNESDERLLDLIKNGTESQGDEALSIIYHRSSPGLMRFINYNGLYGETAQDIFAETWLVAVEKINEFVWQDKPIKSWLCGIARNKMREHWREEKKMCCTTLDEETYREPTAGYKYTGLGLDGRQHELSSLNVVNEVKVYHFHRSKSVPLYVKYTRSAASGFRPAQRLPERQPSAQPGSRGARRASAALPLTRASTWLEWGRCWSRSGAGIARRLYAASDTLIDQPLIQDA